MTAQGPELRALADTLREAGESGLRLPNGIRLPDGNSPVLIWVTPDNLSTIISAVERAASAEGEKAEGRYPTPRADSMSSSVQSMPNPYRSAS